MQTVEEARIQDLISQHVQFRKLPLKQIGRKDEERSGMDDLPMRSTQIASREDHISSKQRGRSQCNPYDNLPTAKTNEVRLHLPNIGPSLPSQKSFDAKGGKHLRNQESLKLSFRETSQRSGDGQVGSDLHPKNFDSSCKTSVIANRDHFDDRGLITDADDPNHGTKPSHRQVKTQLDQCKDTEPKPDLDGLMTTESKHRAIDDPLLSYSIMRIRQETNDRLSSSLEKISRNAADMHASIHRNHKARTGIRGWAQSQYSAAKMPTQKLLNYANELDRVDQTLHSSLQSHIRSTD